MNTSNHPPPQETSIPPPGPSGAPAGFLSLRAKLSIFVSLVVILVCTGLSAVLIQQEAAVMRTSLLQTGSILVKTLNKVSINRLVIQDTDYLTKMLEGALSAPEVVYAIARDQGNQVLVKKTKGRLVNARGVARDPILVLNPVELSLESFQESKNPDQPIEPIITVLKAPAGGGTETVYDFTLPIYRQARQLSSLELFSSETLETTKVPLNPSSKLIGIIQIGLTTAHMQKALDQTVWNIGLLTIGVILIGVLLTILLANRIVTPLRRLAGVAKEIAQGKFHIQINADSQDEVGQLTKSVNQMADALQQREESISTYVSTITKQVTQLSTLHQTGTVITSTLDVDKLFSTVLKLLQENLGFQRMVLVLKDPSQDKGIIRQVIGVPPELEREVQHLEFSITLGTLDETLLIQGQSVLVENLEDVAAKMNPRILELAREVGVVSFVSAPLISHQHILGYVGADKGQQPCTQEDLTVLMTIANHIAVAIDNARTYQDIENFAQTLEKRVKDRTFDLETANERLLELDKLKSAFVSIVSHELRTPMTSIKGLVENMMDGLTGNLNERQEFYLGRVKHNIERLTRMINDLLDLSRIEAGRMDLQTSALNIGSLAREVVELLQPLAQEESLTLNSHIVDPVPLIQGDRDKLIQILTNLVNNAIKFTDPPGTITVEVRYQEPEKMVEVCIVDTGSGIPPDEQQTIFERFYRGQSPELKNRGAGLGLAITKSLVDLHGGKIWVTSILGEGSRFYIQLPLQVPESEMEDHRLMKDP